MSIETRKTAISKVFPTWNITQEGAIQTEVKAGTLRLLVAEFTAGPRAVLSLKGKSLFKTSITSTVEECLLEVKAYIKEAFPV